MMTILPFKKEHTYCPFFSMEYPEVRNQPDAVWEHIEASQMAFSAQADGHILGFGGVHKLVNGTGEAWTYLTKRAKEVFPCTIHKAVKRHLEIMADEYKLRRVQMNIKSDFEVGKAWALRLGFFEEGPLYAWGYNNEDYIRYVRLFCEHPKNIK